MSNQIGHYTYYGHNSLRKEKLKTRNNKFDQPSCMPLLNNFASFKDMSIEWGKNKWIKK